MKNLYYHITNDSDILEAAGDSEQIAEYLERKNLNIKNFDTLSVDDSEYKVYTYEFSNKNLFTMPNIRVDILKVVHRYLRRYHTDNYYSIYN